MEIKKLTEMPETPWELRIANTGMSKTYLDTSLITRILLANDNYSQ